MCSGDTAAGAACGQDRLLLWAVAGLTGVVISSARPAGGRAALGAPRAVLWAEHTGSLNWPSSSPAQARNTCSLQPQQKYLRKVHPCARDRRNAAHLRTCVGLL